MTLLLQSDARRVNCCDSDASPKMEYRAKLDNLARQYATRVTVDWAQTLELAVQVHRFTVQLRRRKADPVILLDWNPLARALEPNSPHRSPSPVWCAMTHCIWLSRQHWRLARPVAAPSAARAIRTIARSVGVVPRFG
jgi:hypothetical protein